LRVIAATGVRKRSIVQIVLGTTGSRRRGQADDEPGAFALPGLDGSLASVGLDQSTNDSEPEASALVEAAVTVFWRFEDVRQARLV
jgi:hypothetical protein